ncbi:MAG: hypothetical protein D6767_10450, partial [Candidatus Hydrogenedentota bacterium]
MRIVVIGLVFFFSTFCTKALSPSKHSFTLIGIGQSGEVYKFESNEFALEGKLPLAKIDAPPYYHIGPFALFRNGNIPVIAFSEYGQYCQQGENWLACLQAPKKPVWFLQNGKRPLRGMSRDSKFAISKHEIYFLRGGKYVRVSSDFKWYRTFSAIEHDAKNHKLYIGTTTDGLFMSVNYHAKKFATKPYKLRFKKISSGLPSIPHSKKVSFYEEIRDIFIEKSRIFALTAIQGGI